LNSLKKTKTMAKTQKRPKRLAKSTKNRYKSAIKRRRPVHKKILLHPSTIIVLIIFGCWLIFSSLRVSASSFIVTATVPAPLPTAPAVITSPANQSQFTTEPITVSGTCPLVSYVELYDNGGFSGVVYCSNSGTFSLQVQLVGGSNVLSAEVFNITDNEGPTSPSVTVYCTPTVQPISTTQPTMNTNKSKTTVSPLTSTQSFVLRSSYSYRIYGVGQVIPIPLTIVGGIAPYGLTIAWGDGQVSTAVRSSSGSFQLSHSYSRANGLENYQISIQAVDSIGQSAFIQLMTVVRGKAVVIATTKNPTKPSLLTTFHHWLWLVWMVYLMIVLILLSYWLGELEEYKKLKRRQIRA
jgi:hypothetical protein